MIFKDYYKILELDTNKVTLEQIKVSFREQAKKYHPDVNKGNKIYEERFKDINEAYRILSNSATKRKYDRMWNSRIGRRKVKTEDKTEKKSPIGEFVYMFFGKEANKEEKVKSNTPIKGENIETEIKVTLEDAFNGVTKRLSLRTVNGKMKTFEIKIPEGIQNGEKIRLIGQGKKSVNGGKNGDLLVKINIQNNKKFKLMGYDLLTDICVSPWEAALGKKLEVSNIDETIKIYIPAGVQTGQKIEIPEKGYKDGKGGRGKFIAQIKTMVPKELSQEEKDLFKKLQEVSNFNPRI